MLIGMLWLAAAILNLFNPLAGAIGWVVASLVNLVKVT